MTEVANPSTSPGWSVSLPAWLLSVLMHAGLLVALGATMEVMPRGVAVEPGREVGVVLRHVNPEGETYYESPGPDAPSTTPTTAATPATAPSLVGATSPIDVSHSLPPGRETVGVGEAAPSGQATGATGFTTGPRQPWIGTGGKTQTSVYGLKGEGNKFAYVFDRSASMADFNGRPMRAAKAELLASIDSLGPTNQFLVIFYNDRPTLMRPDENNPHRLFFGTPADKNLAKADIQGFFPEGGTEHEQPLIMALAVRPDVIFFLTDAEEIGLTRAQLDRIKRANYGTSINAIEFGTGPAHGRDNFLVQLARENDGGYTYVDVSQGN